MRRAELGQGVRGLLPEGRLTFGQDGNRGDRGGQASCNDGVKKNKTAMHSFAVLKNHDTPFHKCQEDRAKKVVLWVKVVAWVRFLEPTW